jgi:hypothetical protein
MLQPASQNSTHCDRAADRTFAPPLHNSVASSLETASQRRGRQKVSRGLPQQDGPVAEAVEVAARKQPAPPNADMVTSPQDQQVHRSAP